eukprot:gene5579-11238_t
MNEFFSINVDSTSYGIEEDLVDDCDDFKSVDNLSQATIRKISLQLHNDGFRTGRDLGGDLLNQNSFNEGFHSGIRVGQECGKFYAEFLFIASMQSSIVISKEVLRNVGHILFSDIPAGLSPLDAINRLKALISVLSLPDIEVHLDCLEAGLLTMIEK